MPIRWVQPLTFTLWFAFIYFFWRIGDPFPLISVSRGIFTIEQGVSRVGVVGVFCKFINLLLSDLIQCKF